MLGTEGSEMNARNWSNLTVAMQLKWRRKTCTKGFQVFSPFAENSMKPVTLSFRLKKGIWIKIVENRKIWKEREKLKYFDRSNAKEMMTKNLYERCLSYFLPFTENSMKRVTFSCPFKEGIWKKLVGNRRIWNERKKLK